MLTRGAIGNLVNRYKAVLKKCNLINIFGSLAVASMLVLGGASTAGAAGGSAASGIVNNAISGTGDYTITVSGTTQGLVLGNSSGTASETVSINGFDSIVLDGGHTNHQNMFNAYKTTTLNFTNIGKVVSADTSDLSNTTVFHAQGGTVNIGSESAPLTDITLKNVGNGFMSQNDGSMTVYANNIVVESAFNAVQCSYSQENSSLIINANNISLSSSDSAGVSSMGGSLQITARGQLSIEGSNAVNANYQGTLTLTADEIYIEENKDNQRNALRAANGGSVTVSPTSKATIIGNVHSEGNGSDMNVELGTGGSLTGTITTDSESSTNLGIGNGSNWNATGDSSVTNLALDNGNVNILAGVDITADNATGSGNINMEDAAELGSFTAGVNSTATVNVQATDAEGKVKNADEVSVETLQNMRSQVTGLTNVTASAAEGDVNGAITVDASGNAKQARNTLMDAALKQASVTTVALDKILTNDVRKRLGDIRSDKNTTGVWMRWDGGKLSDNGLSNNFNTIQIGGDTKVGKNCRLGVAGTFTHGDAEFARGTAELEGFTFATYATWMGENGMFADVVARLGHFSNEMKVEGRTGDMDNRVFSLSGEYGWRLPVCNQFFIEPQVELAYTYVSSDELELGTSKYAFDNVNSLTGRAGVVFGWNLPDDRGNVYARASVLQQFMGDAKITGTKGIAHNVQELDGNDTWIEYGIGANVKLTDKTYIWADVERTEGADIEEEWRGTVGIRYSF